ncbi:MAG: DUF4192 domain-containing protein, partial [Actinobacteria bacterium]|nr:DUF4192 domain-containing protein [Actinomycetota bacterium]
PKLILRSPVDVAASVPYLLGFVPDDSVVFVFFDAEYRHVLTARIDWPQQDASFDVRAALLRDTCRNAVDNGARQGQIVLYPPAPIAAQDMVDVAAVVQDSLHGVGIGSRSVGSVVDGYWRDLADPPGEHADLDDQGVAAACQWVAKGVSYLPDRASMVECIDGLPTWISKRLAKELEGGEADCLLPQLSAATSRRTIEDEIFDHLFPVATSLSLDSPPLPIELPDDQAILRWTQALADRRIREPLLWRFAQMYGAHEPEVDRALKEALAGLALVVRNTPDEVVAAIASCTAALAWQQGNGALAQIAAERGLKSSSSNVLCDLVFKAVEQGVHPSIWVEMLNSMTLQELRSGQARKGVEPVKKASKSVRDCPG